MPGKKKLQSVVVDYQLEVGLTIEALYQPSSVPTYNNELKKVSAVYALTKA